MIVVSVLTAVEQAVGRVCRPVADATAGVINRVSRTFIYSAAQPGNRHLRA